jgi:hypothetical protein
MQIMVVSLPVRAYLSLFLKMRTRGRDSLSLWGPWEGLGACCSKRMRKIKKMRLEGERERRQAFRDTQRNEKVSYDV